MFTLAAVLNLPQASNVLKGRTDPKRNPLCVRYARGHVAHNAQLSTLLNVRCELD